jgi:hypothetical protein
MMCKSPYNDVKIIVLFSDSYIFALLLSFPVAGTFPLGEIRCFNSVNPLWGFVSMAFMFSIDMNALRAIE